MIIIRDAQDITEFVVRVNDFVGGKLTVRRVLILEGFDKSLEELLTAAGHDFKRIEGFLDFAFGSADLGQVEKDLPSKGDAPEGKKSRYQFKPTGKCAKCFKEAVLVKSSGLCKPCHMMARRERKHLVVDAEVDKLPEKVIEKFTLTEGDVHAKEVSAKPKKKSAFGISNAEIELNIEKVVAADRARQQRGEAEPAPMPHVDQSYSAVLKF